MIFIYHLGIGAGSNLHRQETKYLPAKSREMVTFRLDDLLELDALWYDSISLRHKRDMAFLHVAYSTLLRISELARLRVRDISRATDGRIIPKFTVLPPAN